MNARTALVVALLALSPGALRPQETQAEPQPASPVPGSQKPHQKPPSTQAPAPDERRASRPNPNAVEPDPGPLTPSGRRGVGASGAPQQSTSGEAAATIRVRSRLINVALNVVDAHGTPIGGLDRAAFQILEDGKPQPIAVFERESSSPLSIVLAVDASETVLTSDRLEREAARRFVRGILRDQDELDLIDFSDSVREIIPFTNNPRQVEAGLGRIQQGQQTALYNAVFLASQRLASTSQQDNRRRVLVLISDGGDSGSSERYQDAIEEAQRANAIIYAIIVVPVAADAGRNTAGEHTLIQMSEDTGGKYYYVEDPRDLEPAFRHVSEDLRTQYLLGYYSPDSPNTGFRRIRVRLVEPAAAEKYSLRYRTGYYADPP